MFSVVSSSRPRITADDHLAGMYPNILRASVTRNGQNKLRLSHVTRHISVTSSRFPLYRDGIQISDVDGRYDMLCLRLCVDVGQLPHAAQSFPSVSGQLSSWGTTGPSHLNLDPSVAPRFASPPARRCSYSLDTGVDALDRSVQPIRGYPGMPFVPHHKVDVVISDTATAMDSTS